MTDIKTFVDKLLVLSQETGVSFDIENVGFDSKVYLVQITNGLYGEPPSARVFEHPPVVQSTIVALNYRSDLPSTWNPR